MSFIYEIETRFRFKEDTEVYKKLPFLKSVLTKKVNWKTTHYGLEEFRKDIVIRISYDQVNKQQICSLGYKEADLGKKLNIRKEYDEEITSGVQNSKILSRLGGSSSLSSSGEVKTELKELGYQPFMSFSGNSYLGAAQQLELDFKLMYCNDLKYPILLEVEVEAETKDDIVKQKQKLLGFIEQYDLAARLVPEEPPTLLYQREF